MTKAALRGKPEAGNLHARFYEGEVLSVARRGMGLGSKNKLKRIFSIAILLATGSLLAADDLPWIPIEGTNRAPSLVISALPVTLEIDTRPGPFSWESAGSDVYTLPWGFGIIFK